jgi:tRNA(fMet)-specific endonuclease VapC
MRYLLDTNICIYIAKQKPLGVLARFQRLRPGDVGMSVITYLELVYGAWKSQRREENLKRIKELEPLIPGLPGHLSAWERLNNYCCPVADDFCGGLSPNDF